MTTTTAVDAVAGADELDAAQRVADLFWTVSDAARAGLRMSVVASLTPVVGSTDRAVEVWDVAVGTDRPNGRLVLADALAQCREKWAVGAARDAAVFKLPLASGGEVSGTEDANGVFTLDVSSGTGSHDSWADARLTGAEVLALSRKLAAQPGAQAALWAEDAPGN